MTAPKEQPIDHTPESVIELARKKWSEYVQSIYLHQGSARWLPNEGFVQNDCSFTVYFTSHSGKKTIDLTAPTLAKLAALIEESDDAV